MKSTFKSVEQPTSLKDEDLIFVVLFIACFETKLVDRFKNYDLSDNHVLLSEDG